MLALASVLAACGGGAPTKQEVVARADAICAGTLRDIRATPAPTGGQSSLPALAAYLRQVVPIVDKEAAQLRALPRPAQDRAVLDRYITAVGNSASEYRGLAAAAARGDRSGVVQALSTLQANPVQTLAQSYGLSQCSGATGTGLG